MWPINSVVSLAIHSMLLRRSPAHCNMWGQDTIFLAIRCMLTRRNSIRLLLWNNQILAYSHSWGSKTISPLPSYHSSAHLQISMVQRMKFVQPQTKNAWRCTTNFRTFFVHDSNTTSKGQQVIFEEGNWISHHQSPTSSLRACFAMICILYVCFSTCFSVFFKTF